MVGVVLIKVVYWKLIDEALLAVIRSLAGLPPLVATPTIVFTGSEPKGIGVVVASAASDVSSTEVKDA
jgi:hypothetical protein